MPAIKLGSIYSDLGRNKLGLRNRAVVVTAIQSQRIFVTAPASYVEIVMWHGGLQIEKGPARSRALYLSLLRLPQRARYLSVKIYSAKLATSARLRANCGMLGCGLSKSIASLSAPNSGVLAIEANGGA